MQDRKKETNLRMFYECFKSQMGWRKNGKPRINCKRSVVWDTNMH